MAFFTEVRCAEAELTSLFTAVSTLKCVVLSVFAVDLLLFRMLFRALPFHAFGTFVDLIRLPIQIVVLAVRNTTEVGFSALFAVVELYLFVKVLFGAHLCVAAVW